MAKKTKQEEALDELTQESENLGLPFVNEIVYDSFTYAPAWNETFQRFDLLKILINSGSESVKIIREPTKFQHDYQIHAEVLKRINEDFVKKGKK